MEFNQIFLPDVMHADFQFFFSSKVKSFLNSGLDFHLFFIRPSFLVLHGEIILKFIYSKEIKNFKVEL